MRRNKKPLEKLNDLLNRGGEPIGFIGMRDVETGLGMTIHTRTLEEYGEDEEAHKYLDSLSESAANVFKSLGAKTSRIN